MEMNVAPNQDTAGPQKLKVYGSGEGAVKRPLSHFVHNRWADTEYISQINILRGIAIE